MSDNRKIRISRFERTVQILQVLYWRFDGQVKHETNASGILRAELVKVFGEEKYGDDVASSFSSALKQMEEWGYLHRRVNGRRTSLLACNGAMHQWPDNVQAAVQEGELLLPLYERETAERVVLELAEVEQERLRIVQEAVEAAAIAARVDLQEAEEIDEILHAHAGAAVESYVRIMPTGAGTFPSEHDVARALLEQCFEILQRPDQLKDRLGEQTTFAQRLQKQNEGLEDEVRELRVQTKSLYERLQAAVRRCDELQKNVNTLAAERIVLDPGQRREWEKLMREFPTGKGDGK